MSEETWAAVDQYVASLLIPADPVLEATLASAAAAELPPISVTPPQGKLLHLLARMQGARRILEIGTLAGYSAIWLGRALPADWSMVTLEANPTHADLARRNLSAAGLAEKVEVRLGGALDTLPQLDAEGKEPFDFIFIDADRTNLTEYFEWALRLSRVGSVIVVDNVVRKGGVVDAASEDPNIKGVRRFNERLANERRVTATAVQTVGAKGYDGFAVVLVTG